MIKLLRLTLLLCALIVGSLNTWADPDETVTFSEQGYSNQQAISSYEGTDFSVTFNKGTNNNAPKYYTSGSAIRAYGGNYFTVSSTTKTIEKIVITFGSSDGSNAITTDEKTYQNGTWEGSASSVTFTIGGTSGNRRIAGLEITYASGGGGGSSAAATTTTISTSGITNTDLKYGTAAGSLSASVTLTSGGTAVPGATVTWSGDNDDVATIDASTGAVTLVGEGTVKFTASYAGVTDTYASSSAQYQMTVTDSSNLTSTLTFTSAYGNGPGTADDGAEWTVTSDGTESSYDNSKGIHYGTSSAAVQYISLSTSDINGTIKKVVVNASTASGVSAVLNVTVGGQEFGTQGQSVSSSASDYTFTGTGSGEIVVTLTKSESATKALYLKSIKVYYEQSTDPAISASDVNIAYDATNGSIDYTLENATGNVSATVTSGDWLTLGTITSSAVPFTCSANTGAERTATVTLSFSGAPDKVVTITQAAAPSPEISANDVNIVYDATSGSIDYTLENATGNVSATVTSGDWLTLGTITSSAVPFTCSANTGAERTATVTLSFSGAPDKVVTITQAAAPLANIAALTAQSEGSYNVALNNALVTYVNGTNAYLEDESGAVLLYHCAGDLAVGDKITGTANVTYTVYNSLPEVTAITLAEGYTKTSGNTVTPTEVTIATLESNYTSYLSRYVKIVGATVTSAFSSKNCTIEQSGSSIVLRDQNSTATLTTTKNAVVTVTAHPSIYNSTHQIAVYEQSQIVLAAKVDPTITFNNGSVRAGQTLDLSTLFTSNSSGEVTYSITSGNSYATIEGSTLTGTAEGSVTVKAEQAESSSYNAGEATATITVNPALVLSSIAVTTAPTKTTYNEGENFDPTGMVVTATYSDNSTEAVTGYTYSPDGALSTSDTEITISYTENSVTKTTTQAITVNEVHDYATLPFAWDGGVLSDYEALTGTSYSLNDEGSYAAGNAPYRIKFTKTGDYLQVKTDSQPGMVTIGVKMLGGANDSSIDVMQSANGIDFSTVQSLTITGSQNTILNLETTNSFAATTRYVRLYFNKGSNVGVGPISIAKPTNSIAVTGVSLDIDAVTLNPGETQQLTATVSPDNATNKNVTWESNDPEVATVSDNGLVTAVAVGTATITVTTEDGDFTATCNVTVNAVPQHTASFSVNGVASSNDFYKGQAITFPANPESIGGYTFQGWYASEYTNSTTAPTYVTEATMDDADVTYYAVFAKVEKTADVWSEESLANLTTSDVFVIVGDNGATYAMSNDNGTSKAPAASAVTVSTGKITSAVADNLKWNISGNATNGYTFYPNGNSEKWLYCTNTNNGVRVGTNDSKTFAIDGGYLKHEGTSRYVGIYNSSDWRCYTSNTGSSNIKEQSFTFYKLSAAGTTTISDYRTSIPVPESVSISVASNATWIAPAKVLVGEQAKVYTVTYNGTSAVRHEVSDRIVPANAAVLLTSATEAATVTVTTTTDPANSYDALENELKASDGTVQGGDNIYALAKIGVELGFYKVASSIYVPAGKAYLEITVPDPSNAPARIWFDGETTAIDSLNGETGVENDGAVYDLSGRRVNGTLSHGLYIKNGKKFIVK